MLTEIKTDYVRSGRKRPSSLTVKQIDWLIEAVEKAQRLMNMIDVDDPLDVADWQFIMEMKNASE